MEHENDFSFWDSVKSVWRPYIQNVPKRFRAILLQKEVIWTNSFLKSALVLWASWYALLIFLSDLQKDEPAPYILIRTAVIIVSGLTFAYISLRKPPKAVLSGLSLLLAALYMMSYVSFSFVSELPLRTTWIAILPACFIITTASSGRAAILWYIVLLTGGLLAFRRPINSIFLVSDTLFGFLIILAGLTFRYFWTKSTVLTYEREETEREAIQNEMRIYAAIETFVPKAIRNRIKTHLNGAQVERGVLDNLTSPDLQPISILYSDFRNYSVRSANINFIKDELIESSSPIIEQAERFDGIVQNRGDSLLIGFFDQNETVNTCRAVLVALLAAKNELLRVSAKGRNVPDRYMIVTSGKGVLCNLGNKSRNEITIAGKPANLAARIDEITKQEYLKRRLIGSPTIVIDYVTNKIFKHLGIQSASVEINLKENHFELRSYEEEKRIYTLEYSESLIAELEKFLSCNTSIQAQAA